jgi:hypothetical protein
MDPDQTVRWAGWSGSMLVANTLCWFCCDAAQMSIQSQQFVCVVLQLTNTEYVAETGKKILANH